MKRTTHTKYLVFCQKSVNPDFLGHRKRFKRTKRGDVWVSYSRAHDKSSPGRKINAICDKSSCVKNFILFYIYIYFFLILSAPCPLSRVSVAPETEGPVPVDRYRFIIIYYILRVYSYIVDSSETHSVDPFFLLDQSPSFGTSYGVEG